VDLPEVAAWIETIQAPFVIGNYVYADGTSFLKIAGAVDALIDAQRDRAQAVAYLATPTDVYAVPEETVLGARGSRGRSPFRAAVGTLSASRLYKGNYSGLVEGEGRRWGISDCLVPIQGPNYALAKALQRWRAVVTRDAGTITSANVAPASRTSSVTKNRLLDAAYSQAHRFGIEILEPETSRALMAALLVHDLREPAAAANPELALDHPFDLFAENAAHGGIWRMRFEPRSVLPVALLRGMVGGRRGR
jgi:hypothetical protein